MAEALTKAGRYQIVGELGRGSMGIVYRGFDPMIRRTVAIKTMLPEGLSPQEFQEYKTRFQREAMAAGILAHPNIITVYDFGEDNGVLYLAMEFLQGTSLEKMVQEQGVLPMETILPIYEQICSALDHAHRNKVVHRDIKPANIMILENGLVKVTDFGIAKMMAMGMTQAGQILGTPNYMSPEQVKGRQIDGRSDIFSLGVILYELVTGEKPFGGQNITTVIYKIINENPIPPRELDATIPAGMSYVISKALAKNPDERYQTCHELAEDLKNYRNLSSAVMGQGTVMMRAAPEVAEHVPVPPAPAPYRPAVPPPPPPPPEMHVPAPPPPEPPLIEPPVPPAPSVVEETPIASSLNVQVAPPPKPRPQSAPQIAWVMGALLVVAIMGGITFYLLRPHGKQAARVVTPPPAPVATPVQNQQTQVPPPVQTTVPATETITPVTTPVSTPPTTTANPRNNNAGHPVEAKVGQLMVTANVDGAAITVDGRSNPAWVTPFTIPDLGPGTHNVSITKEGYDNYQQSVTVESGQVAKVEANLSSPKAEFDIATKPPGLEILIDGKSYGPSPVRAVVEPGIHTYTVKRPGADPYENSVKLQAGSLVSKTVTLGAAEATGIVELRSTPPGATVTADGAPVGGQTPTSFRLGVGTHILVIALSGYQSSQRQVTVTENATTTMNVNLTGQ